MDAFKLFEHIFRCKTITLCLLEEEGSVVETLEEICLSNRSPPKYFILFVALHRSYLFCKSLKDVHDDFDWRFLQSAFNLTCQTFLEVILIPSNDKGVVLVFQIFWLVDHSARLEVFTLRFLPFSGVLKLFG